MLRLESKDLPAFSLCRQIVSGLLICSLVFFLYLFYTTDILKWVAASSCRRPVGLLWTLDASLQPASVTLQFLSFEGENWFTCTISSINMTTAFFITLDSCFHSFCASKGTTPRVGSQAVLRPFQKSAFLALFKKIPPSTFFDSEIFFLWVFIRFCVNLMHLHAPFDHFKILDCGRHKAVLRRLVARSSLCFAAPAVLKLKEWQVSHVHIN